MRRVVLGGLAAVAAAITIAVFPTGTAHADDNQPGQPCSVPGQFDGRHAPTLTMLVCWGTHVWTPWEPDVQVPLGSPCTGNSHREPFGIMRDTLVDGYDTSGRLYYAWCDQGVWQTPPNYPMTQSGPIPVPV
jgi:hypothetical protein